MEEKEKIEKCISDIEILPELVENLNLTEDGFHLVLRKFGLSTKEIAALERLGEECEKPRVLSSILSEIKRDFDIQVDKVLARAREIFERKESEILALGIERPEIFKKETSAVPIAGIGIVFFMIGIFILWPLFGFLAVVSGIIALTQERRDICYVPIVLGSIELVIGGVLVHEVLLTL